MVLRYLHESYIVSVGQYVPCRERKKVVYSRQFEIAHPSATAAIRCLPTAHLITTRSVPGGELDAIAGTGSGARQPALTGARRRKNG